MRRIVHVSSLSVYAVPTDGATMTEDSPYDDGGEERGFYARSKLLADQRGQRRDRRRRAGHDHPARLALRPGSNARRWRGARMRSGRCAC